MDNSLRDQMTSVLEKMLVRQPDDAEFWFDHMTTNVLPAWIRMLNEDQRIRERPDKSFGAKRAEFP